MESSLRPFLHKAVVLPADRSAFQAAMAMAENQIGCVLVSDHRGHIIGILTDRDLASRVLALNLSPDTAVEEIMTGALISLTESSSLRDAVDLMIQNGVRRIPVLRETSGGHQKCVGLVTLDDLLASEAVSMEETGRIVRAQISRGLRRSSARSGGAELEPKEIEFVHEISEALDVNDAEARALCAFVFSCIVRRLHYTAAVQFISLLPSGFHNDLLSLPAGPDRSIDGDTLLVGVGAHLRTGEADSRLLLRRLWRALETRTERGPLNHILYQLPEELRALLREELEDEFSNRSVRV